MTSIRCLSQLLVFCLLASPALAQRPVRVIVTVVDSTGGVLPGATVELTGLEDATKKTPVPAVKASEQGVAIISDVAAGRYSIQAEFSGFERGVLKDVRLRPGDNKHNIILPIQGLTDSVTVARDAQEAAADRQSRFGTAMTREQIDALSDDPAEMQKQLQEIAGGNAVLRIDSFEGAGLPPKAQIKAIHITRDAFAAENHSAGGIFIDIITQPGLGPLRGGMNLRLRNGALSGRSPFTATKGPEQTTGYGANFSGSLIPQKSSFNVSINGQAFYDTPNLNIALPDGTRRSEAMAARARRDNVSINAFYDQAITLDQTLRIGYSTNRFTQTNLGIGGYDELERGYANRDRSHFLRVQEAGPLGRRFFINTRVFLTWSDTESASVLEAPTIRVNDAFTRGGAQVAGGRHSRQLNAASDLDYVRGNHSVRGGIVLDSSWVRSDDRSNYLGTYTFESLEAFDAGRARTYTKRIGDPNITYYNLQAAIYVQDDIRVRRGLTITPGVRIEMQTHLRDANNIGPRFGITWAPFRSGKTTLRTSWGIFHDWLSTGTYEQSLRVDGFRQQELNIVDPAFPDPGNVGLVPAINRYLLGGDLDMARTWRVSAGVDHAFAPRVRVGATYAYARGGGVMRGRNLNLPVDGVRPNADFANIVEVVSDGALRTQTLSINGSASLSAQPPGGASGPRIDWRRMSFSAGATLADSRNNSDGAFRFPPNGLLDTEWGPANNDVRLRGNLSVSTAFLRNFSANIFLSASTGTPYTIRTGTDDNGDLEFNDRPAGVARNTERTAGQMNVSGSFTYMIPFGTRTIAAPPGIRISLPGAGPAVVETIAAPEAKRYRLVLGANIQNLTNHRNYTGYSGIMTSPFFRTPTAVAGTRKIDLSLSFQF